MKITATHDNSGDIAVHKAGCAHLNRLRRSDYTETFEADSLVAVAARIWEDQIRESESTPETYTQFLNVAPCATRLLLKETVR